MQKLCCIFNIPSLYRETIYRSIDNDYDCEWYFEKEENDINVFDIKKLKLAYVLPHKKIVSRFYSMKGLVHRVWNRNEFDKYLIIGAPMCTSIWMLCILLRIFHPQKKIYFWTHGWYGKETMAERLIKKAFFYLADEIFLYGNYAKQLLIKEGFNSERLHVIHNSLAYDVQLNLRNSMKQTSIYRDHFGNDNNVLLFVGRLTPIKQLHLLIHALNRLRNEGKFYNLIFVGSGEERANLETLVDTLHLEPFVWFYGECYDEKTNAELIYNADLCVAPGNIGLTAMHSMMFGCPALTHGDYAYQMPEFEAIKVGKTGDFFERNNAVSIAKTIDAWFNKPDYDRNLIRKSCYGEIDCEWTPRYQMSVFHSVIG
jgi:glycosyltransferase involved in cell wall biosynthesis